MTMITPSYLGETIEYSSLHACRSTLEDPTSTSMLNLMLGTGSPGSGLSPILQTGGPRSLQATVRFRF